MALVAVADLLFSQFLAVPFDKRAFFVSYSAAGAMVNFAFLVWDFSGVGKVGFAEATVDAAGCNQIGSKLFISHKMYSS